jgi:hypothetical protein
LRRPGEMKTVISASRRTDLVAFFPEWLAAVVGEEKARVYGPSRRIRTVDLNPENVHTFVLWSKNFANLIANRHGLLDALRKYDQLYFHLTVTGLGGSEIERQVPAPTSVLRQLEPLLEIAGRPDRISLRFDPIVHWEENDRVLNNLDFFENLAGVASRLGVTTIRTSFAQWYGKAKRRAARRGFRFIDPPIGEKLAAARRLADLAAARGLRLYACAQDFLASVPGISRSSCIDGALLEELHPQHEPVSRRKDRTQRPECGCTESLDIGSYAQSCPHSCVYCYANPGL